MTATSVLGLDALKSILDSNYSRLVKEAPRLHRVKLKAVGACILTLNGELTERSRSSDLGSRGLEATFAIDLSNVSWTFEITMRGTHQIVNSARSQVNFEGVSMCEAEVPGIVFSGDMSDRGSDIFREQGVRLIKFCPAKGADITHDTETGEVTLTWQGRLYRGGDDFDWQVAACRKRSTSTNESD